MSPNLNSLTKIPLLFGVPYSLREFDPLFSPINSYSTAQVTSNSGKHNTSHTKPTSLDITIMAPQVTSSRATVNSIAHSSSTPTNSTTPTTRHASPNILAVNINNLPFTRTTLLPNCNVSDRPVSKFLVPFVFLNLHFLITIFLLRNWLTS